MRALFDMWSNTRMVVLMALSAALYAALLIPFKFATLIPGLTEIRPAACVPVVTGILFGPAACWGSGLGNIIGDVAGGQFGPGSIYGFCGNFFTSFVAWKLWEVLRLDDRPSQARVPGYLLLVFTAAATCALIVGWGVDTLGIVPFAFLATAVFLNNIVSGLFLGPMLLGVLLPRASRWGLRYRTIMDISPDRLPSRVGALLLVGGGLAGFIVMMAVTAGLLNEGMFSPAGATKSAAVAYGALPFLLMLLAALAIL